MLLVQAWDNLAQAPPGWGSHLIVTWEQFEPSKGKYRFDLFESSLARRARPCFLQLAFSMFDKAAGVPVDYSARPHKRSLRLTVNGRTGEIPPYDVAWTDAYCRAVEALGAYFAGDSRIAGFWTAAGWNQESQAAAATRTGDWGAAARAVLSESAFLGFLTRSTQAALAAWQGSTVYLPGAPSPGGIWGHRRRDVLQSLLAEGAGYMNCGLSTDNDTAWGVGERAGQGMYDIAAGCPHIGFEEGSRRAPAEPLEVYWWLLRAAAWQADFVNLYGSISAPHALQVADLLPKAETRWIVFRDREYPETTYSSGGTVYGHGGEPGCWGLGILPATAPDLQFTPTSYGYDRWVWDGEPELVLVDWPGTPAAVTCWMADGTRQELVCEVEADGTLRLPAGRYHRVDVVPAPEPELTLEQRIERLEERVGRLEGVG